MIRAASVALAIASAIALVMCQSSTQITVLVTTDVGCAASPSTAITVGTPSTLDSTLIAATRSRCDSSTGSLGSLVIVPSGSRDDEIAFRVVTGIDGRSPEDCITTNNFDKCIVARRALRYIPHATLEVAVAMRSACTNVPCDSTHTCVKGACFPSTIADPSQCERAGGCDETTLTPGGVDGGAGDAGDATVADTSIDTSVDTSFDTNGGDGSICAGACPTAISAGDSYTCRVSGGQVLCWGYDDNEQLGRGSGGSDDINEQAASGLSGVTAITSGQGATCAIRTGGGVSCWGYMPALDVIAPARNVGLPSDVAALNGASFVAVDTSVLCWKNASGVSCAGFNTDGELGQGDLAARSMPVAPLLPSGEVTALTAGNSTVCALMADGSVWCWGGSTYGEGDPTDFSGNPNPTPKKIDLSAFGPRAIDVAISEIHGCVVMQDTTVVCWGYSDDGATGHVPSGGFAPARVMMSDDVTPLSGVARVSLGWQHSCALLSNGQVTCWGNNASGQLGRGLAVDAGITVDRHPQIVTGFGAASVITSGQEHTCAMTGAEVWCWGDNQHGEMGIASTGTPYVTSPRRVR